MHSPKLEILTRDVAEFPVLVAYLEANFTGTEPDLVDLLLTQAGESPYALSAWIDSLVLFRHWLNTHQLTLPITNQISYIACSAEGGSAYATLTQLPAQVQEMLETYGCDAAERA